MSYSLIVAEPVVEATITVLPPIFAIAGSWPGPISGRVSWIAPFRWIGQPGRKLPFAPLTA